MWIVGVILFWRSEVSGWWGGWRRCSAHRGAYAVIIEGHRKLCSVTHRENRQKSNNALRPNSECPSKVNNSEEDWFWSKRWVGANGANDSRVRKAARSKWTGAVGHQQQNAFLFHQEIPGTKLQKQNEIGNDPAANDEVVGPQSTKEKAGPVQSVLEASERGAARGESWKGAASFWSSQKHLQKYGTRASGCGAKT